MAEWLARVNEWLKAQNPGSAIADGAGDMGLMSEDLKVRIWHLLFIERETGHLKWQHYQDIVQLVQLNVAQFVRSRSGLLLLQEMIWLNQQSSVPRVMMLLEPLMHVSTISSAGLLVNLNQTESSRTPNTPHCWMRSS